MRKIDFLNYSIKDFLLDESFQRWIDQHDVVAAEELDNWLEMHPEKRDTVEQARKMLIQMQLHFETDTTSKEIEEIWSRIQNTIDNTLINQDYKM